MNALRRFFVLSLMVGFGAGILLCFELSNVLSPYRPQFGWILFGSTLTSFAAGNFICWMEIISIFPKFSRVIVGSLAVANVSAVTSGLIVVLRGSLGIMTIVLRDGQMTSTLAVFLLICSIVTIPTAYLLWFVLNCDGIPRFLRF